MNDPLILRFFWGRVSRCLGFGGENQVSFSRPYVEVKMKRNRLFSVSQGENGDFQAVFESDYSALEAYRICWSISDDLEVGYFRRDRKVYMLTARNTRSLYRLFSRDASPSAVQAFLDRAARAFGFERATFVGPVVGIRIPVRLVV